MIIVMSSPILAAEFLFQVDIVLIPSGTFLYQPLEFVFFEKVFGIKKCRSDVMSLFLFSKSNFNNVTGQILCVSFFVIHLLSANFLDTPCAVFEKILYSIFRWSSILIFSSLK